MTRFDVVKVIVQHSDTARSATRTVRIEDRKYVDRTADETEVLFYTATDAHATVAGVLDDDHLAQVALDSQVLRLAERVLHQHWWSVCTAQHHRYKHSYTALVYTFVKNEEQLLLGINPAESEQTGAQRMELL